jgi:hypothetical protein
MGRAASTWGFSMTARYPHPPLAVECFPPHPQYRQSGISAWHRGCFRRPLRSRRRVRDADGSEEATTRPTSDWTALSHRPQVHERGTPGQSHRGGSIIPGMLTTARPLANLSDGWRVRWPVAVKMQPRRFPSGSALIWLKPVRWTGAGNRCDVELLYPCRRSQWR